MGIYKRGEMYWARWSEAGHIERRSLETKDRAEAERRFKDVRAARRTEGATLKACFEGWLAYKRLAHRAHPRSIESFATASRRFVAEWGHVAAERGLSVVDIDRFKTERLTTRMLPSTVNNDLMSLHNALVWGKRAGLYRAEIPETKLLKVAKRRVPKFLAPRDVDALLETCEGGGRYLRVAPYVQLAAYAGLRRDEIRWLTWGDVDLDRGLISVVEKPGEWSPKSFERSVDIDAELAGWLKTWRDRVRHFGCGTAMGDWVAPFWPVAEGRGANQSRPGVQWCRVWIGQEIRALFDAASVERPRNAAHTLHMLRGTYAVRLLQGGADLETVRQLLGHANIATTAIYLSATSGSRRRALKGLRQPLD